MLSLYFPQIVSFDVVPVAVACVWLSAEDRTLGAALESVACESLRREHPMSAHAAMTGQIQIQLFML